MMLFDDVAIIVLQFNWCNTWRAPEVKDFLSSCFPSCLAFPQVASICKSSTYLILLIFSFKALIFPLINLPSKFFFICSSFYFLTMLLVCTFCFFFLLFLIQELPHSHIYQSIREKSFNYINCFKQFRIIQTLYFGQQKFILDLVFWVIQCRISFWPFKLGQVLRRVKT